MVHTKVGLLTNKFSLVTGTSKKSDKSALRENYDIVNLTGLDRASPGIVLTEPGNGAVDQAGIGGGHGP
jgi:hypothetical protein